jgi:hypothetical protein
MFYKSIKNQAQQFLGNYGSENPATFAAAQQAIGGLLMLDGFIGIDNPFGGKKRSGIFGSFVGILLGLGLVFGTGTYAGLLDVNDLTANTTATVVSVNQQYTRSNNNRCTIQAVYTISGKEYTNTASGVSSSTCALTQGQVIDINYDPNNPGTFAHDLDDVKTVLKIIPIAGAILAFTSIFTFAIRLLSIIFGWKLLKSGRTLAKTLPAGTDLSTIKNEIKQNFAKSVFGIGNGFNIPSVPQQTTPPVQDTNDPNKPVSNQEP